MEAIEAKSEHPHRNEDNTLFRENVRVRQRRLAKELTFLNTKLLKVKATIIELLPPRPLERSLGYERSMGETTEALRGMANWKTVG